jgi:hypothetical protein
LEDVVVGHESLGTAFLDSMAVTPQECEVEHLTVQVRPEELQVRPEELQVRG